MNAHDTSSCQCTNCPGRDCSCGCQHAAPQPAAGSPGCACRTTCGCDAAESGCLCAAPARAA